MTRGRPYGPDVRGPALVNSRRSQGPRRCPAAAKIVSARPWRGHTGTMDLPRAEIRYHGIRAVGAGIIRSWDWLGTWFRPRAAPLLITALATLCMLAGLDLIARDFRRLHAAPTLEPPVIYLMSAADPGEVIPVELAPMPAPRPASVKRLTTGSCDWP